MQKDSRSWLPSRSKTITEATPPSTDPKFDFPIRGAIGEREVLEVIAGVLTTESKLGDERHKFSDNIASVEIGNQQLAKSIRIILRSHDLHAHINIKSLLILILVLIFILVIPLLLLNTSSSLENCWNAKCVDKVTCR